MNRRQVILVCICLIGLSGCGGQEDSTQLDALDVTAEKGVVNDTTPTHEVGSPPAVASRGSTPAGTESCWSDDQRGSTKGTEDGMERSTYSAAPAMAIDANRTYTAAMKTNKGSFNVEFFANDAPQTVNNFVCLARDGYFDGTPFHRIVAGFVIQGGDPTGTGRGGPGYQFADETISKEYERGILAMANAGPNTNGSQFFVVLDDLRGKLPKNYTIFGRVTAGLDVVDAIAATPTKPGPTGERSVPTEPVTLEKVTVSETT